MATTIHQFFGVYLDGCRRQHIDTLVACHALPCVIATPDDQRLIADRQQLEEYCHRLIERHASRSVSVERFTVRSTLLLGDEFAVANVAWSTIGQNRSLRTFHAAYNVRRQNGDWAIWAVTEHETISD